MVIVRPEARHLVGCAPRDEADQPEWTLADIEADTGRGPTPDLESGVFHASTEDFIASMRARRNGSVE